MSLQLSSAGAAEPRTSAMPGMRGREGWAVPLRRTHLIRTSRSMQHQLSPPIAQDSYGKGRVERENEVGGVHGRFSGRLAGLCAQY